MKPSEPDIVCPECGARNPAGAAHCEQCGARLPSQEQGMSVWRRPASGANENPTEIIDVQRAPFSSSQATTPFQPNDRLSDAAAPIESGPRTEPVWTSETPPVPPAYPTTAPSRLKPGGPPGCVLGAFGLLIILIVAGLFVWSIGRSYVRNQVGDRITSGISTRVGAIPPVTVPPSGQITLTQDEINNQIRSYSGSLDPISDPVATIDATGIHVTFKVYGTSSAFSGLPVAAGGKIVILKPKITGVAGQVVDANQIGSIIESQLAALLSRSGVTPASVALSDGSLTVTTTAHASANSI